jgi:hypothetical protein
MADSPWARFDLTNMKGSTMDAMSDAIEGAEVMLYGISKACASAMRASSCASPLVFWVVSDTAVVALVTDKESANVSLSFAGSARGLSLADALT